MSLYGAQVTKILEKNFEKDFFPLGEKSFRQILTLQNIDHSKNYSSLFPKTKIIPNIFIFFFRNTQKYFANEKNIIEK